MRNLLLLMAMTSLFGNLPSFRGTYRQHRKPIQKPDAEKFLADLKKLNEQKSKQFPNWKTQEINGFPVVASNVKTAIKTLTLLLKSNGITTEAQKPSFVELV